MSDRINPNRPRWFILAVVALSLALVVLWPFGAPGAKSLSNEDRVVQILHSPDGMKKACVIERMAGRKDPFKSYSVMVLPGERPLPPATGELSRRGSPRTEWQDGQTLRVTVSEPQRFLGVVNNCDDVKVAYTQQVR